MLLCPRSPCGQAHHRYSGLFFLPITTRFKTRDMQSITANSARMQKAPQECQHKLFLHIVREKQRMGELKTIGQQDAIAILRHPALSQRYS